MEAFLNRGVRALLDAQPLHAAEFHDVKPIACTGLAEDAMNVVAHGLLGKAKLSRNLLIRHTARNQQHKLLLAAAKPQIKFNVETGNVRALARDVTKKGSAE